MATFLWSPDCGNCRCQTSPFGLMICAYGCGCPIYQSCPPQYPRTLAGATITLRHEGTIVATGVTVAGGCARFLGLAAGTYDVEVQADRHQTRTTSVNYTPNPYADVAVHVTPLCPEAGYSCYNCARPIKDELVLTFDEPVPWIGSPLTNHGSVGPITFPDPITITRRALTATDYCATPWFEWPFLPDVGWYGETTIDGQIGAYTSPGLGEAATPCEGLDPTPQSACDLAGDCARVTYEPASLTFAFYLLPCHYHALNPISGLHCGALPYSLVIVGPPITSCRTGPYCLDRVSYFCAAAPSAPPNCLANSRHLLLNTGSPCVYNPGFIPPVSVPAATRACDPLTFGFYSENWRGGDFTEVANLTESS